jgi:UDP-N-acetyl-2-amino-2-deoxyglucuronate dehydrogenase
MIMATSNKPLYFALIGAAGYVAPRHMKAIRETGNELVAALDPYDGVGIMDSYFPEADFFIEPERFDRHLDKLRRLSAQRAGEVKKIDFVSICSPNYMHDAHIRLALRNYAHAICEKPVVLNPWNAEAISDIENEYGKKVYSVLQLRHHPKIAGLRDKVLKESTGKIFEIDLTYITSRGKWYFRSWKGDESKSGGIATNIGVHFFDMLSWIFGNVKDSRVHILQPDKAAGLLELDRARVRWFLSLDKKDLPGRICEAGKSTFRLLTIDEEEFEFSEGFTDLHTVSYQEILAGKGYGLQDAKAAIDIVYGIRNSRPSGPTGDYHPLLKNSH